MNKNLLIVGAGQFGLVTKEIAESTGMFDKIDFLDDKNTIAIGKVDEYKKFVCDYQYAIVAVGNNDFRLQKVKKLIEAGFNVPALISPKAYVSPTAKISCGTIVEPMAVVQANSSVSIACLVCSGAVVQHNATVDEGCYLDCNCVVHAGASVSTKIRVQSNTTYFNTNN